MSNVIVSEALNDRKSMMSSPVSHAVYRAPGGRRCGCHGEEYAERKNRH